jgi:hypothetical protein
MLLTWATLGYTRYENTLIGNKGLQPKPNSNTGNWSNGQNINNQYIDPVNHFYF